VAIFYDLKIKNSFSKKIKFATKKFQRRKKGWWGVVFWWGELLY
jgi:hypothetical protein